MARFGKARWPSSGPVRELLSYLDALHSAAGRPSLTEMGRSVALAPSTLSAFFTGTRLIGRGNLELVVEHLAGDTTHAETLRRAAVNAWATPAADTEPDAERAQCEFVVFDAPVNTLNRPERLVGRRTLLDELDRQVGEGRRILLYGLGGTGKTAIAATLADQRVAAGKGAYLWLRTGHTEPDTVLDTLVNTLGTAADREQISRTAGDAYLLAVQQLITRTGVGLCVIDDVWQTAVLHQLLRALPGSIAVIVTSRLRFGLDHTCEIGGLDRGEAVALLALHARRDTLTADADAAGLCQDLGYHAYAIEIAGTYLRQYEATPAELRSQIAGAPDDLAMPGGLVAPGRESVRRLLDRSYAALTQPDAGLVLQAFGALPAAGATTELLAAFLQIDAARMPAALHALMDLSLVKRNPGTRYYTTHDLTCSYARSLGEVGTQPQIIERVRVFVRTNLRDHELLSLEADNIVGFAALARTADPDSFLDIVDSLVTGGYLDLKGAPLTLLRLLDQAIDLAWSRVDTGLPHRLLSKRGNVHYNQGEYPQAIAAYRAALDLAPNDERRVILLAVLGKAFAESGDPATARDHFARAYAICDTTGDEYTHMRVLEQHSVAAFREGDYAQVADLASRGVELARRLGTRPFEATFRTNLGTARFKLGVHAAIEEHDTARRIAEELGDDHVVAMAHRTLGADYQALEDFETAHHHFAMALKLFVQLGQTDRHERLRQMMQQFGYPV